MLRANRVYARQLAVCCPQNCCCDDTAAVQPAARQVCLSQWRRPALFGGTVWKHRLALLFTYWHVTCTLYGARGQASNSKR